MTLSNLRDDAEEQENIPSSSLISTALVPSTYQEAIFSFVETGSGSAVVDAVAGSGKTTTVFHSLIRVPKGQTAIVLAFNTDIVKSFQDRLDAMAGMIRCDAKTMTFHSAAFRALGEFTAPYRLHVEGRKILNLCRLRMTSRDFNLYSSFVAKLISLAKAEGVGSLLPNIPDTWKAIYEHHDIQIEEGMDLDNAIERAMKLLQESTHIAKTQNLVDFDDQLYLVGLWDVPTPRYDWVFIDEAQDTNRVRRDLATRLLAPGGRLVAVGDPRQAIYGFTGASHDAIEQIQEAFGAQTLPLSVNYRCSLAVIEKAKTLVPHIEPRPNAPQGKVEWCTEVELANLLTAEDAILCRNNAPLLPLAYDLISHGVPCQVLGRDIGKGLVTLIKHLKGISLPDLIQRLRVYKAKETARFAALDQPDKADRVTDQVDCILAVVAHLDHDNQSVWGLVQTIEEMFASDDVKVGLLTLSTVHKAKGKEWRRVAILRPDLMPAKWAKLDWQRVQEENLKYVAWTRAKEELYFVVPPKGKDHHDRGDRHEA